MRRDPDLIRLLMLQLEERDLRAGSFPLLSVDMFIVEPYTRDQTWYHINQLLLHGWIDTGGSGGLTPSGQFVYKGLSPEGHDFVDTVRDLTAWSRIKEAAGKIGGYTLDSLIDIGRSIIAAQLKNLIGMDP